MTRTADEFSPDGHTRCYVVNRFDPISHSYPSIPCWFIFDDKAFKRGPVVGGSSGYSINREGYKWSRDNSQELANGVITKAESLEELAKKIGVSAENMVAAVQKWSTDIKAGQDTQFNRPI